MPNKYLLYSSISNFLICLSGLLFLPMSLISFVYLLNFFVACSLIYKYFKIKNDIKESPAKAYGYARLYRKKRYPFLEKIIATDIIFSYHYAREVLKGRFELGEEIIATSDHCSYLYAQDIIQGRFELGEAAIATSAYYSYIYTLDALKGRFKLGEKVLRDSEYWERYCEYLGMSIKKDWRYGF